MMMVLLMKMVLTTIMHPIVELKIVRLKGMILIMQRVLTMDTIKTTMEVKLVLSMTEVTPNTNKL